MKKRKLTAEKITRREFMYRTSMTALSASALSGAYLHQTRSIARAKSKTNITYFCPQGPDQDLAAKEVARWYIRDHSDVEIKVVPGSNAVSYPKMLAARRTTPDKPLFDLGYFNPETVPKGDRDNMWLPLDPKTVSNLDLVFEEFRRPGNHGAPVGGGLVGLVYNKEKVKEPPTSWRDLWENPFYRKKVVLFDYLWAYNSLVVASRLNGGSEKNMDPGFEAWAKGADQILALVTSTKQMLDLMVTGDAALTVWFKGNQVTWEKQGAPLGFVVPKEGAVAFPLYLQVIAGVDPHKRRICEELINLTLNPLFVKYYCEATYMTPLVKGVRLKPELADDPSYSKDALTNALQLDWATMTKHNEEWKKRWDREVKARL